MAWWAEAWTRRWGTIMGIVAGILVAFCIGAWVGGMIAQASLCPDPRKSPIRRPISPVYYFVDAPPRRAVE